MTRSLLRVAAGNPCDEMPRWAKPVKHSGAKLD